MEDFWKIIIKASVSFFSNACALMSGFVMAIVGYLYPIFDISAYLLFLFFLDVVFGAWKAKKLRRERVSMKIVWQTTFPRMLIAFLLIACTYMWDQIANQTLIDTANTVGLFFAGALMFSIAENGYHITKWFAFRVAAIKINGTFREKTGIDIEKESKGGNDEKD